MENKNSLPFSKQHEQAVKLHNRIMASASLAQQSLWEMCTGLKQMRDGKLYKELGYQNFEDYCENEVGMKRANAHKYISIVENINPENVSTSKHFGVSKLYLLSTISESEQQEISEKVDLESTTVKELKAEIDKLKGWNKELGAAKDRAVAKLTPLEEEVNELKGERERANKVVEKLQSKEREITRLERENKELRNRPTEVAVVDHSAENERKLDEVIRSLERENMKRNEEMRAKMSYAMEVNERGKTVPVKVGLAPVQRDNTEYEFDICFQIGQNHIAEISKDTTFLDGWSGIITPELGSQLNDFLSQGINLPRCTDCNSIIMASPKKTVQQIIDGSIKVYGKQLCLKCVRNLVKAAKENAAPAVSE